MLYTKIVGRKDIGNCNGHPTAWQCLSTYSKFDEGDLATVDWDIRNHPPYSPYLGTIDFHLCGSIKCSQGNRNFKLTTQMECPELTTQSG